jgi:conjugal transfer/entry exclusion protein
MMRCALLAGVTALALAAADAHAAIGVCTTWSGPCASLPQQILDYARQAEQLAQEVANAQNTLNIYVDAVRNTAALPQSVYRDMTTDISQIVAIGASANMLRGLSGQILTNIGVPGAYPAADFHQQFANEANAVGMAMRASAAILSLQPAQLEQDAAVLASLQGEGMADAGRQATLQTLGGTTASAAQAVEQLQATVANNQQAVMTYFAAQQDRQYLTQSTADRDLESAWTAQCAAAASLGGPAISVCAGAP